ncbi:MAG: elongation factor P [Candidatus Methylacidiphilales bacterium]
MSVNANDLRKGMAVKWNGDVCIVLETQHRTPGNLRAFVQGTLRSIKTGRSFEQRFNSNEKIETVNVQHSKWDFNYKDHNGYTFLNTETYETLTLPEELVASVKDYLVENLTCDIMFVEDRAASVEVPSSVELKVVESPEGVKGDSANNVMKAAKLETGLQIQVPLFIKEGETIRVDTRTGKYISRA